MAHVPRLLLLCASLLLAGCATPPAPDLQPGASGDEVRVGRFSRKSASAPLPDYWQQYIILPSKPLTRYSLVDSPDGVVLEATAEASASGLHRKVVIDPMRHPVVEWRWRVEGLIPGADKQRASREDSPARLVLLFHGNPENLDVVERSKMRLASALSGREFPYATLMYVSSNTHPVGTVLPNPHTDRIQMIVVATGEEQVGRWKDFRRNVLEDYQKAFGEVPEKIVSVGVMTDTDNTGQSARSYYGDISFLNR